jgi:DNA-binding MarR family transcriptional regulator
LEGFFMFEFHPIPDHLSNFTGFILGRVAGLVQQFYGPALAPLKITGQHLAILLTIEACGPQIQAHLSSQLGIDKTTMVELLNLLEQQERVKRHPHPQDRRAHLVHLTPEGTEAIRQAKEIDQQTAQQVFSVLTPSEQQYLLDVLMRLGRNANTSEELMNVSPE